MEKEEMINISSVLESYGMSFEVQLYSPLTGDCELVDYSNSSITIQGKESKQMFDLDEFGRLDKGGVKVVFPSVLMMDWKKLLWKTGIVLRNKDGELCAFEDWTMWQHWDRFNARFIRNIDNSLTKDSVLDTRDWEILEDPDEWGKYYNDLEKEAGKKIDRNTLEFIDDTPKFKPFDKVLVRNEDNELWIPQIFLMYDDELISTDKRYRVIDGKCGTAYKQCLLYEGNEDMAFIDSPF